MEHRHPTGYCSVCGKHVVLNIHGTMTTHRAEGEKIKICPGSELGGTIYPKGT